MDNQDRMPAVSQEPKDSYEAMIEKQGVTLKEVGLFILFFISCLTLDQIGRALGI